MRAPHARAPCARPVRAPHTSHLSPHPWPQLEADGTAGKWNAEESLPWNEALHGGVSGAWLNSYSRKDGTLGHRVLVGAQDHSLRLLQPAKDGGKSGWVREEALASVDSAEFIPLPSMVVDGVRGVGGLGGVSTGGRRVARRDVVPY